MSTPPGSTEGLELPAERARRGGTYLGALLAAMLALVIVEGLMVFVSAALIEGEGMRAVGWPGVGGYVGLPVIAAAVSLPPLLALAWRHPALRIDSTGISKVGTRRAETVRWVDIDKVRFNSRRSYLLLVLKADALPERPNASGGPRAVVIYSLGNSLWRRRRPGQADLIVDAVERFAPGKYTV
ncbi:PH domain-containing protein [Streptomyces sp. NPDC048438]|uniref:PH domain-containing protein n=1 Tax=Streptomyces sp. NPDC048438 TaxID=3365551 RepID=UPI00370FB300